MKDASIVLCWAWGVPVVLVVAGPRRGLPHGAAFWRWKDGTLVDATMMRA